MNIIDDKIIYLNKYKQSKEEKELDDLVERIIYQWDKIINGT